MLAGLFVIAIANGFFLGLTIYGLLAAAPSWSVARVRTRRSSSPPD
jgi:hypothetical protein